jgi:molybdenum cofactor biosynthesis enzyme MoaA
MTYNAHLNPMTEREFLEDPFIRVLNSPSHTVVAHPFESGRLRLSITELCNFACPFCYNEGSPGTSAAFRPEQVRLVLEAARPWVREIKLVGGEPLLHPEFAAITATCADVAPTTITTNGVLLRKRIADLAPLSGITVSVQSLDCATYQSMMGTRSSPEEVLRNVRDCRRRLAIPIDINCVVGRQNQSSLCELVGALAAEGVRRISLLGLLKMRSQDQDTYYPLRGVVEALADRYGDASASSSTRLQWHLPSGCEVSVVYQYCMVGCDVCRTDGFIRVDPSPAVSYCLASPPISLRSALQEGDREALRVAFSQAIAQMGRPTGHVARIAHRG